MRSRSGPSPAGYFEVARRKPYTVDGRQIDGSVTVEGTTDLNELKFTTGQSGAPDVDVFDRRSRKRPTTQWGLWSRFQGLFRRDRCGLGPRTPVRPTDHSHLDSLLTGSTTFAELTAAYGATPPKQVAPTRPSPTSSLRKPGTEKTGGENRDEKTGDRRDVHLLPSSKIGEHSVDPPLSPHAPSPEGLSTASHSAV